MAGSVEVAVAGGSGVDGSAVCELAELCGGYSVAVGGAEGDYLPGWLPGLGPIGSRGGGIQQAVDAVDLIRQLGIEVLCYFEVGDWVGVEDDPVEHWAPGLREHALGLDVALGVADEIIEPGFEFYAEFDGFVVAGCLWSESSAWSHGSLVAYLSGGVFGLFEFSVGAREYAGVGTELVVVDGHDYRGTSSIGGGGGIGGIPLFMIPCSQSAYSIL